MISIRSSASCAAAPGTGGDEVLRSCVEVLHGDLPAASLLAERRLS